MSFIIKVNKPAKAKAPKVRKARQCAVKRVFPKAHEGMPTRAYIEAYHAANASVHLTVVEYVCN